MSGQGIVQTDLFGGEFDLEAVDYEEQRRLSRLSTTQPGDKGCYNGPTLSRWGDGFKADHPFIDLQVQPTHKMQDHIDKIWDKITEERT